MHVFRTADDLRPHVGKELGASEWVDVDQNRINAFAEATGDHQWIHVDVERAAREMPGGKTIAHGYLTLSLLPMLMAQVFRFEGTKMTINYGSNRVRFTHMVPSGSRVRGRVSVKELDEGDGQFRVITDVVVEIEGETRPALMAEIISLVRP